MPLGSGAVGSTSWSVVAYESRGDGTCVEVRFEGAGGQAVCRGRDGGPIGANVITGPAGRGGVVVVGLMDRSMVEGSLPFDLQPGIPVDVVDAGRLGRYAIGPYAGVERPLQLLLRDETVRSRETHGLR